MNKPISHKELSRVQQSVKTIESELSVLKGLLSVVNSAGSDLQGAPKPTPRIRKQKISKAFYLTGK